MSRQKKLTQADIDRLMADEPAPLPNMFGAGGMALRARLGVKENRPSDARGHLSHAERAQFVLDNPERLESALSPEELQRIEQTARNNADQIIASEKIVRQFHDAIVQGIPLHELWLSMGHKDACPLLNSIMRDGDPQGLPESQIQDAMKIFADSPFFAAYRYRGSHGTPRYEVQARVIDILFDFMVANLVNLTHAPSWAGCFAILQNAGVLPAPLPTDAEIAAAENAKPAKDGREVAHDENGRPIVHKGIRYSEAMLGQLSGTQYAEVIGLVTETPDQRIAREQAERKRKAEEYRTLKVHGTAYTQAELDAMPSEKYRKTMGLERDGGWQGTGGRLE